jgi:hypothetical protein
MPPPRIGNDRTQSRLMFADQLNTFNDLTKTSIELDDGKTYALVPFNLDDLSDFRQTS